MMGVETRIVIYHPNPVIAEEAAAAAFDRIAELDAALSDYRIDSELNRLSEQAGQGPVPLSPDLFDVLIRSIDLARATGGAFDPTVGPIVRIWREARETGELPDPAALEQATALVGYEKLVIDPKMRFAILESPDMRLDLGGIGKGYAADRALRTLRFVGCPNALVDVGGDLAIGDPPPGRDGWRIETRYAGDHGAATTVLANCGIATSSDAEQAMVIGGERFSHIIDPRSGDPLRDSRGVSVVAPDATSADALASAFSVLGDEESRRMARRFENVRVYFEEN